MTQKTRMRSQRRKRRPAYLEQSDRTKGEDEEEEHQERRKEQNHAAVFALAMQETRLYLSAENYLTHFLAALITAWGTCACLLQVPPKKGAGGMAECGVREETHVSRNFITN